MKKFLTRVVKCGDGTMTDDIIRLREEITEQRRALENMKKMAEHC